MEELQSDLDEWLVKYNTTRTHQGKHCNGKTPMETFLEGKEKYFSKVLNTMRRLNTMRTNRKLHLSVSHQA